METALISEVFFDAHMPAAGHFAIGGGKAAVRSVRSPDRPDAPNEDSAGVFSLSRERIVLALADGMGGSRGGAQASRLAIEAIADALGSADSDARMLRAAILDGFENANRSVLDLGIGAATTLTVVEIADGTVRPYHVGDSDALAVGRRGRLKWQTVAHSPVGYAVRSGVLDERRAMDHDERHIISNAIGSSDMHIEVGPTVPLAPLDTVLLASDGLTDNLHTDEIIERIRRGPIEQAAARLGTDATERMATASSGAPSKPDDLTFVIFRPRG